MTTKIAFLGFTEGIAQCQELFSSLFGGPGNVEVAFPTDLRSAVAFLVSDPNGTGLDGSGNVAYILRGSADVQKLGDVAAKVNLAFAERDEFQLGRSDEDIVEWLNTGSFPALPEPEPVAPEQFISEPVASQPEPAFVDPLDDLLGPSEPVAQQTEYAQPVVAEEPALAPHTHSATLGSYQPDEEELQNSAFADDDIPLPGGAPHEVPNYQTSNDAWGDAPTQAAAPIRRAEEYVAPQPEQPQYVQQAPQAPVYQTSAPAPENQAPVYQQPQYVAPEATPQEPVQYAQPQPSFDDLISGNTPTPQPQYQQPQQYQQAPTQAPPAQAYQTPPQQPQPTQAQYQQPQQGYQQPYGQTPSAYGSDDDLGIVAPSEVRQAMPSQLHDSVVGRSEHEIAMPVQQAPAPAPETFQPAPDPIPETPPYMERLDAEDQSEQRILEEQIRMNPAYAADEFTGKSGGRSYYVTGSHGGVGKTTVAYMLANVVANAIKAGASDPSGRRGQEPAEVWLVEADYRNPKLAHRLQADGRHNSGTLARFLAELDKKQAAVIPNLDQVRATIIRDCVIELPSGAKVVTCPYDITSRETAFIQAAIQQIVTYAVRRGAHVFIDADTLSSDDILDRNLATRADTVVMVADSGHIDDLQRSANTMMKRVSDGGMGIAAQRISVFLNRTQFKTYVEKRESGILSPLTLGGFIPRIAEWDTGWVGDHERGESFLDAIAKYAVYALTFVPIPELKQWESYQSKPAPRPKKGFLSLFRRAPKVKV